MSARTPLAIAGVIALALATIPTAVAAPGGNPDPNPGSVRVSEVAAYWTPAKRAAAIPRDLALDDQGRGFIRSAQGWQPYGGSRAPQDPALTQSAVAPDEFNQQALAGDTTKPSVNQATPAKNAIIGSSSDFVADVSDAGGIKSVQAVITFPSGSTRSYGMSRISGTTTAGTYRTTLSGFTDSTNWKWHVVAKDSSNNTTNTSLTAEGKWAFTVDTTGTGGGGGGGTGSTITDATWGGGGSVQAAAGRIYFEMPSNGTRWSGYVCSGTAVSDGGAANTFSLILTAAHCVYDDSKKAFARNVLFIPNQSGTQGTGTDRDCTNDPIGCWVPSYGVVDSDWTIRTFPDNVQWDHAYYVVPNSGAHNSGLTVPSSDALESATPAMGISVGTNATPTVGSDSQAMGYSYSQDPLFRYCAEPLSTTGTVNWWLGSCGLSGGASGGPWLQPAGTGDAPIFSVNSWGYTNQPGMAGPKLDSNEASCLNTTAKVAQTPTNRGFIATCN